MSAATLEEAQAEAERLEAELEEVRARARQLAQGIFKPVTLKDLPKMQRYFNRRKRRLMSNIDWSWEPEDFVPTGEENVALMRELIPVLRKEHERGRFVMAHWFKAPEPLHGDEEPACGTQACLAGWTMISSLKPRETLISTNTGTVVYANGRRSTISEAAQKRLGLTNAQRDFLFYEMSGKRFSTIIEAISFVFGEDFR